MLPKLFSLLYSALSGSLLLVATASLAAQTTIHVGTGQSYTTIQSAIDAAGSGDTVLVDPGTYTENIDFKGKAITVTTSAGSASTILDGSSSGPAVTFDTHETSASTLSGFTIQHGGLFSSSNPLGSIVVNYGATPTILNNIITLSNCWAIDSTGSAPVIQGNTISATQDSAGNCSTGGAAILISGGSAAGNYAGIISGNTFENNSVSGQVGSLDSGGAGIYVNDAGLVIENNIFRNNSVTNGFGGALRFLNANNALILNNLIYNNTAGCGGGAIATGGTNLSFINNTIADNTGGDSTSSPQCAPIAQIYLNPDTLGNDSPTNLFINNIISGSTANYAVYCTWTQAPSESLQPTFQNNILLNSGGLFFGSNCVDVSTKYNNLTADPQFTASATHDYTLTSASPAIDHGQNSQILAVDSILNQSWTTDFAGNPRVANPAGNGCLIDLGAYEYPGGTTSCLTTETLTSSLNPAETGQSITFTAKLTSQQGTPAGSVQFLDGKTALATQTVSSGSAAYTTSALSTGSHAITAIYQPTGSFIPTIATFTQTLTNYPTTTALACQPSEIPFGGSATLTATVTSSGGTPTGSIAFTENGAPLATNALTGGSTTLTYTSGIPGAHTVTATYIPTGPFAASSAACTETVDTMPTTTTLTATPNPGGVSQPITLTATVNYKQDIVTNGTITFYDGSTALNTATLTSSGTAVYTASFSTSGAHSLTAVYSGYTGFYSSSTSAAVQETIDPADFSLSLDQSTATLTPGQSATVHLNIGSLYGFSQPLSLNCSGLPANTTCAFNPATLTQGQGETTLTIQTTAPHKANARPALATLLLSAIALLFIPISSGSRNLTRFTLFALAAISALGIAGCGSSSHLTGGTPPGTYTITVTAASSTGTAVTHSTTVTLTINSQ